MNIAFLVTGVVLSQCPASKLPFTLATPFIVMSDGGVTQAYSPKTPMVAQDLTPSLPKDHRDRQRYFNKLVKGLMEDLP